MKQAVFLVMAFSAVSGSATVLGRVRTAEAGRSEGSHVLRGSGKAIIADGHAAASAAVPVPTITHEKEAGSGYAEGSPLFARQEETAKLKNNKDNKVGWRSWLSAVKYKLGGDFVYILLVLLIAFLYRRHKSVSLVHQVHGFEGDSFTYGFFDIPGCIAEWKITVMAFFCPAIRWADNVSEDKVPMLKFWAALLLFLILTIMGPWTAGIASVVLALVGMYFRQRLRFYFGHGPRTLKTLGLDALAWFCCPCCAIVQEAREVEKVHRKN